jgi:hypothetical protein
MALANGQVEESEPCWHQTIRQQGLMHRCTPAGGEQCESINGASLGGVGVHECRVAGKEQQPYAPRIQDLQAVKWPARQAPCREREYAFPVAAGDTFLQPPAAV